MSITWGYEYWTTNKSGEKEGHAQFKKGSVMSSLTLVEAARFLNIHPETLRGKAKAGEIPGAKIGRSWVFIESDLESHIRSQYAVDWRAIQGNEPKEVQKWPCIVEQKAALGGSTSLSPVDKEYERLLGQKTGKPRSNSMMS